MPPACSCRSRPWRPAQATPSCSRISSNLAAAARIARPFIRNAFDKAPPTLLDWKGELAARYGFEPEVPNIYVFDHRAELLGALSGPGSAPELAALHAVLEGL